MTSNIHSLEHIVESVIRLGPLWTHSAICDESSIGSSKLDVTGTKGVVEQIMKRSLLKEKIFNMIRMNCKSTSVKALCNEFTNNYSNHKDYFNVYGTAKYEENECYKKSYNIQKRDKTN